MPFKRVCTETNIRVKKKIFCILSCPLKGFRSPVHFVFHLVFHSIKIVPCVCIGKEKIIYIHTWHDPDGMEYQVKHKI